MWGIIKIIFMRMWSNIGARLSQSIRCSPPAMHSSHNSACSIESSSCLFNAYFVLCFDNLRPLSPPLNAQRIHNEIIVDWSLIGVGLMLVVRYEVIATLSRKNCLQTNCLFLCYENLRSHLPIIPIRFILLFWILVNACICPRPLRHVLRGT